MTSPAVSPESAHGDVLWMSTTQGAAWQRITGATVADFDATPDVILKEDQPGHLVEGFGACFNELGWTSLSALTETDRGAIFRELFAPGVGANLSICRTPLGANDFSRDWYSYNETPGDLGQDHFDISNDRETLIPFIHAALQQRPDLQLWASPWSPPTWMKTNKHYAGAMTYPLPGAVDNGLSPEQVGVKGTDMFIQDDAYLASYARYFGRYIDAYREAGINIGMVMPQNEFNSPQVFPSCTWTSEGLTRFLAHLGPVMRARDVEIFVGTLERADDRLIGDVVNNLDADFAVQGFGLQWEGKKAIAALHRLFPDMRLYQTEQECGDGHNDWRQARHAWSLMKQFISNGANAYAYWNIALLDGGVSRWGWTQNSLVTVDQEAATYQYTPDFFVLKHVSAYVQPGARIIDTWSLAGYDDQLVFANPDGSTVVVIQNDLHEEQSVRLTVGGGMLKVTLPADSFNTLVIPPSR